MLTMKGLQNHPTDDWCLVHGEVRVPNGSPVGHAWLLHQASEIGYDPDTDRRASESEYLGEDAAKSIVKYARKSASITLINSRHYGPWHEGAA